MDYVKYYREREDREEERFCCVRRNQALEMEPKQTVELLQASMWNKKIAVLGKRSGIAKMSRRKGKELLLLRRDLGEVRDQEDEEVKDCREIKDHQAERYCCSFEEIKDREVAKNR